MRSPWGTLVLAVLAGASTSMAVATDAAESFSFTPIDVPGAIATYALGNNDAGQIVGFFRERGTKGKGFLRTAAGSFVAVDVPGAAVTIASKINNAGQIVGTFVDAHGGYHGFVRAPAGAFTTIDVPEAVGTYAQGISNAGQIVGAFTRQDTAFATPDSGVQAFLPHGFVRAATGALTTFGVPGAANTTAINGTGQIVGTLADASGAFHGFLRAPTGALTTVDAPVPGSGGTHVFGINDAGETVGFFGDIVKGHGFLRSPSGVFTTIDVPGATQTHALGINGAGQIVGVFEDARAAYHGFVVKR